jgi:hypothetical protein
MNITKVQRVPLQKCKLGIVQLLRETNNRVVWNKFLPSYFNNLTTRGIIGPKFFKSKRFKLITGRGACIERDGVMI